MSNAKTLVRDTLFRMGYSVRSLGDRSTVTAVDLARDVAIHLGTVAHPVLFDVGANEGQTIEEMRRVFPDATIVSFEPSPRTFASLSRRLSGASRIRLENLAVGDTIGTLPFTVCGDWSVNDSLLRPTFSPDSTKVDVAVTTLDRYCADHAIARVDWLKIDTQGFDLHVLRGAASLLARGDIRAVSAEAMFVPMYEGQPSLVDLLSFMQSQAYRLAGFYEQEYIANRLSYCNVLWLKDDQAAPTVTTSS